MVQLLPGAPEDLAAKLEENILTMDQLTTVLDEDGAEAVLDQVLRGLEPRVLAREPVAYRCYCSRERVAEALRSVGAEALRELAAEERAAEVNCQFCGAAYSFSPAELLALAAEGDETDEVATDQTHEGV